ncbi:MAG: hypothetical protein K6G56_07035 [Clostridiales bacterium]|nr:hypothetical protein [Clostridiales bacterium]
MKIKRILSAILAFAMLLSAGILTGCKETVGSDEPAPTEQTGANEPGKPDPTEKPDPSDLLVCAPEKREYVQHASAQKDDDYEGDWNAFAARDELWRAALTERRLAALKVLPMGDFAGRLTEQLIKENEGRNIIWSPVNVYLAFAMLAETSDGETRAQILDLLGVSDINALRNTASALIKAESNDDGVNTSLVANSLWLNKYWGFYDDTLRILADNYGASSYWGDPSDPAMTEALQNWLNENTGGLLEEAAKNVRLEPSTVLAIASTIYFKTAWADEFNKDLTKKDIFHAIGREIECDFMHTSISQHDSLYYKGEGFSATYQALRSESNSVWYLLPDEGVSVEEMLKNGGMDFIGSCFEGASGGKIIRLTAPKMDVSSELDLVSAVKALGVTDCFAPSKADFSPLSPNHEGLWVDQIKHAARVKTDEEGIEAAAFTVMVMCGSAYIPDPEIIDFTLDRPFVFVVTGVSDQPLFIGVVNNPVE